jgi:predicted RND superfamily exporter protein
MRSRDSSRCRTASPQSSGRPDPPQPRRVARAVATHPWIVLAAAALLTVLAGAGIARLGFDNSSERLLVQDSPDADFLATVRHAFGGDEILFVLLRAPDVTAPDAVRDLARLTDAVAEVPGVERVTSLANLRWPWPRDDDVAVERLFGDDGRPTPGAPVDAALDHPIVRGTLVSVERDVAAVLAFVRPRPEDPRFKGRVVADVEAAVATAAPSADVLLGGAPYGQVAIDALTRRDLRLLGSLAFVAMAAFLALTYRGALAVVLPLATVVLSLAWTLGIAGALGISISVVTSTLVPLVLAIATSYCVRVLSEHARQHELGRDGPAAVAGALDEVGATVLWCGAATALGFLPMSGSRVDVLQDLGLLAVIASVCSAIASVTVVPAVLALRTRSGAPASERAHAGFRALLGAVDRLTDRHAAAVVAGGALLVCAGALGLLQLTVDQSPWDWFPEDSPVARSTHVIDERLGGVLPFSIVLASPDGAWDPALLRASDALGDALRGDPDVRTVTGPADLMRLVAGALDGADAPLPDRTELIAQYALLYDLADPATLAPYLHEESARHHVLVRMPHASTSAVDAFAGRVERHVAALVPPPLEARLTGTGLLRVATASAFATGLVRELFLASLAMTVLLGVALRSARLGVLALLPNLVPILLVYGLLGWLGVPLNVATVTTGAAALGNAVDDTVQYLDRYRRLRPLLGDGARRATLAAVGAPMIVSDVVLAAGFAVLTAASFFPVATLGLLGATAMVLSLLANLLLLPAMVALWERRRTAARIHARPPSRS